MKNIKGIFIIFVFATIIIMITTSRISVFHKFISDRDEFSSSIDNSWKYGWEPHGYSGETTLPCVVQGGGPGRVLWISNTLPSDKIESTVLLLRTSQQYMRVFIDGKLVYSYEFENGKGSYYLPGSSWHFVKLPRDYAGKKIEIALVSPYEKYSGTINKIYIGSESSIILDMIYKYGMILVISGFIIMIGFALIILYFFFRTRDGRFKSLLYLGHFSFLSGIWIAAESKIIQLLINSPVLLYYIACLSLFLIPIPLLQFIVATYKPKNSNILTGLAGVFRIFFITASISQIIYHGAFMAILPIYHIVLIACILATVFVSIIEMKNNNNSIRLFFLGCILLCVFSAIDLFQFYFSSIPGLNAQGFMQFAIMLFILLLLASLGQYILELLNYEIRNKTYRELAYTDILTGLKNRTSYEEKIGEINHNPQIMNRVVVIIFDLNNLKKVNDTFGHQAGDRLIVMTAQFIRQSFGKIGEVFRIGGDEFAVIMTGVDEAEVTGMELDFNRSIEKYNSENGEVKIGAAYGIAAFEKNKDKSLHSVIVRADEEMYKCKKLQKQSCMDITPEKV